LLHVEAFMGAWVIIWVWFSGLRTFNVAIFFFGSVCLPGAKKGSDVHVLSCAYLPPAVLNLEDR
jgi:hypothetical protein